MNIITLIPQFNQTNERLQQCYLVSGNYTIINNVREMVQCLLSRNNQICEIWYPHHFWIFFICKLLSVKCVYTPVLCDMEWFEVRRAYNIKNRGYFLKRLRMSVYSIIACNLADLVIVQDDEFVPIWKRYLLNAKKIICVSNFFGLQKLPITTQKKKQVIIVSHSAQHKIYLLDEMLKSVPSGYSIIWAGRVDEITRRKYSEAISFTGNVSRDVLQNLYAESEILMIPSIYEGSPRVIYEAAAFHVKVMCANLRGYANLKKAFPELFLLNCSERHVHEDQLSNYNDMNVKKKQYELTKLVSSR